MELLVDKILCLALGHYPGTNSCKYTWFLSNGLENDKKRQKLLKIAKKKDKICCIKN